MCTKDNCISLYLFTWLFMSCFYSRSPTSPYNTGHLDIRRNETNGRTIPWWQLIVVVEQDGTTKSRWHVTCHLETNRLAVDSIFLFQPIRSNSRLGTSSDFRNPKLGTSFKWITKDTVIKFHLRDSPPVQMLYNYEVDYTKTVNDQNS